MTPLIKLSAISFLLACFTPLLACSDDESEQQERGQNPNNQGGVIQRFEDSQSFNARSLVSAVDSDGTIFVAYIDKSTGLPKMGELDGEHVALPGEWEAVNSLSMVATPDGSFHLVGDPQGAIRYVRRHSDGIFSQPQTLAPDDAKAPNLAVGPTGDIGLVYTRFVPPAEDGTQLPAALYVHRGSVDTTDVKFGEAIFANADCCRDEQGDAAHTVSGASIAIGPDDTIHLVYEWTSFSAATVDYLNNKSGRFQSQAIITEAASIPCPSLSVDQLGAHITYITEEQNKAWYVRVTDSGPQAAQVIYEGSSYSVTMALMTRDLAGGYHVGVKARTDDGLKLLYVHMDESGQTTEAITAASTESGLELTPFAGGIILGSDSSLLFSYHTGAGGSSLAIGTID